MAYNSQNHWVCELRSSYRKISNYKTQLFGKWICLYLQLKGGRHLLCWDTYTQPQSSDLRIALSKGSNRTDVSLSSLEDKVN
jgi:hypothetical protein